MEHLTGRATCDAEIGTIKRGWRGCKRPARYTARRRLPGGTVVVLDYCPRHIERAEKDVRTIEVWARERG